ncbi:DUF6081 family protein [Allonocardiopsis opalescens]|nr:DUF6081 family protein [Allonocardiopsis opalescens]
MKHANTSTAPTAAAGRHGYRIVWDDFRDGFVTEGKGARWHYSLAEGPYTTDDGIATTSRRGLRVIASGTHPDTGEPAFVRTLAQEDDNGFGISGTVDHVKWLADMAHTASSGLPGFDAVPGYELSFETWLSGRVYGCDKHPFGEAVHDPVDELRLASVGMNAGDPVSNTIFDFFLSDKRVYVVYERLPFARKPALAPAAWRKRFARGPKQGKYAAFVYQIPVARRTPEQWHHTRISYDRAAGKVRWYLDGELVYEVTRLGHLLPSREHLVVDHGGVPTTVEPVELNFGLGMFTCLDYAHPQQQALVRVASAEDYFFSTELGEPTPQHFLDDQSLEPNRLWGQGAELRVRRCVVSSRPTGVPHPRAESEDPPGPEE